ncbi:alpha/beta hydrolase [Limnospira fusiformis PMC 851.14]|uniref:Alpha/beta hydrolase n=1 Tax=Limnospira fusiformis PMC 851.14 TaxID=2219512 RepID=A0ABU9EEM5_LIMFS
MFYSLGFTPDSIVTSLGRMVYYTATTSPWISSEDKEAEKKPSLLFLHGFGGGSSAYEWSKVYPAFAADYKILVPDLIGWGRSEHPARDYTPEDYITTIAEFIEATCEEPIMAIASSVTAALTVRVAIEKPELFKGLILTTPSGLSDFGQNYINSLFAQIVKTPILDQILYATAVANPIGIRSFLEQRQFARPSRIYNEIVEAYLESALEPNAEYAALSFVRGDLCFDLSLYIPQLTTPTAMIWGEKSQFTSPEMGERLANLNPVAVRIFQKLEDVGLTPQLELPGVTIGVIRSLLKALEVA